MKLNLIQKNVNYVSFLILLVGVLFISGCVSQNAGENVAQGLQIVLKDEGFPEVKYLQPSIKEVQLQKENKDWITIWSNPEGKALKLTPDGAENVLDIVSVEAGTYVATRLLVSKVDVEVDINLDGDTLDKNQEIILTEEEFNSLPPQQKPSAPNKPSEPSESTAPSTPTNPEQPPAPDKPDKPSEPLSGDTLKDDLPGGVVASDNSQGGDNPIGEEPSEPDKPEEPSQPSEPTAPSMSEEPSQSSAPSEPEPCYKIVNGLVYMGGCELGVLDEKHTATPPFLDGIKEHYSLEGYIFPLFKDKFVYGGSSGKIIYDFTLHPLKPKHEQISVKVFTTI